MKKLRFHTLFLFFLAAVFAVELHAQTQNASTVIAFSTQYTSTSWSAVQATGAPNVASCGDNSLAWASASADGQREYLVLGFATPQPVTTIKIYETLAPDAVDTVYLRDASTGVWNNVFSQTASSATCIKTLTITIATTSYNVDAIRIAINSPAIANWNEIDAVEISTPVPMTYTSSTTTQSNTSSVTVSSTNNEIIGIQIVTSGSSSPLSATSFSLNTTGTTSPTTDITNAKLWYTGTSSTFATTTQFGSTVAAPNGAFTITGTQTLSSGTNYFWLTYDVPAGATVNNFIDGECTSLTVTTAKTPTVTAPAGSRQIAACATTYTLSQSSIYGSCTGTYALLTDGNLTTGAGCNSGSEWIEAAFTCPKTVSAVTVGGGSLSCGWGATASYLNAGAVIQSSTDNITWTTQATISGVTDAATSTFTFSAGCVTAQYWRIQKSGWLAATEFSFTFGSSMVYSSSTTTQGNTSSVTVGSNSQEIIGVQIVTANSCSPLSATSFTFNTTGTTAPTTDIQNGKLWYTGTSSTFLTTTQFGTAVAAPNGSFTITGSQTLSSGTNYFWLTYDIPSAATVSNVVDAQCTSVTVGTPQTPTVTNPAGTRTIAACPATYTASQSSTYSGCTAATYADLTDGNLSTGAGCNSGTEWIQATFSCPKSVTAVTVGGGTIPCWGATASYLNGGAVIQSSTDNSIWTTQATISGVTDGGPPTTFSVGCVTAQYWRIYKVSWLAATEFTFTFGAALAYSSSTTTQNTTFSVAQGALNQEIIGVQVVVTGCSTTPLNATSFTFNTTGSTNPATDISNANVFYSGTSSTFSSGTQFGSTTANPSGSFSITGSQSLSTGTNYFWLAYDIKSTATISNVVDAQCTSLNVGGAQTPTVTNPAGSRTIIALTAPTYQCVSTATLNSSSLTITKPGCIAQYDLMLAHLTYRPNTSDNGITAPAGWTRINYFASTAAQLSMDIFYKVATSSEPANYTFTQTSAGADFTGAILTYRGVDIADPIESSGILDPASTSHTTACVTATTDQTMIVTLFGLDNCSSCNLTDVAWTPPAGMTERYDIGITGSSSKSESGDDVVQATKGCVQKTATSFTSANGIEAIIMLRPNGGNDYYSTVFLGQNTNFNSGASVTLTRPLVKANDLIVAHLCIGNPTGTGATPPSGWTLIRTDADAGNTIRSWLYYKIAVAGEASTYTFTVSSGINLLGAIMAYRGIDPASPFQTSAGTATSTGTQTAPAITTTSDSELVVTFFCIRDQATYTPPAITTERYDYQNAQNHWKSFTGDDFLLSPAGSTGTKTSTSTSAGAAGLAQIAAFKRLTGKEAGSCCGFSTSTPLPIELLSFTVECKKDNNVKVVWTTASEINNDYFTVEKATGSDSQKDLNFTPIGKIKGAGNSSTTLHYEFIDDSPFPLGKVGNGLLYYRLMQTDYDGKYEYSDIADVRNCSDDFEIFEIYPNPNNGKFVVQITSPFYRDTDYELKIYNILGEIVYSSFVISHSSFEIDLSNHPSGVYFYSFDSEKNIISSGKIIIQ